MNKNYSKNNEKKKLYIKERSLHDKIYYYDVLLTRMSCLKNHFFLKNIFILMHSSYKSMSTV